MALGLAEGALARALQYAKERKTFGREIANHQAVAFKLADMATEVEAARLLTLRAATLKDKGVESTELVFDGYRCPAENILGGEEGGLNKGFAQMMDALEVGRANVAARGVGLAQRALELAVRYAQERKTFGKPIAEHQAILFKLADMATKIEAARLVTLKAARMKDAGQRSDLEAGMAKLIASETGKECVEQSFRIHGGYGYSKEYEIERLYRDAPLLLIGEGTSEIQRMVIGRKLLQRHKI
jgi:alkylation response protein AidB-like acyl-CoA dehydrogenase